MSRSRTRSGKATTAATLLLAAAALLLATAPSPAAAASARALLQAPPAGAAGGFGALLQGLPIKEMLAGGGKAFGAWRQGAKQLAQQRRDGADADVVGSDQTAAAQAAGARAASPVSASSARLTNTTVEAVPAHKQLFVYNTTGAVGGTATPPVPKDGTFSVLPAGCAMRAAAMAAAAAAGGKDAAGSAANLCSAIKLEANAGSNIIESMPADGLVSTDGLNATESSRDTALTDFARLKLRYGELSLDDNVAGVPVPFDFTAVLKAGDGARLNGTASGSDTATLTSRMWGMWTNGEPAIPLRSGIFTLVSSNETIPFELMGANYTLRVLGLPVQGGVDGRARGGDDRLFVPTPRDALLGAAALRKELGPEWAKKNMRVQSVYIARGSPVKILLLPAAVELLQPSQAMEDAVVAENIRVAKESAEAEVQAAKDAEAAVLKEVGDYREALLAAAANGTATLEDLLAVGGLKEGEEPRLQRMPLPWRDDAVEGFQQTDAERTEQKQERKQQRAEAEAALGRATPGQLFSQAAKAVELVAQGVKPEEADRQAAELAKAEREAYAKAQAAAAASGEEVYEEDDAEEDLGEDQE